MQGSWLLHKSKALRGESKQAQTASKMFLFALQKWLKLLCISVQLEAKFVSIYNKMAWFSVISLLQRARKWYGGQGTIWYGSQCREGCFCWWYQKAEMQTSVSWLFSSNNRSLCLSGERSENGDKEEEETRASNLTFLQVKHCFFHRIGVQTIPVSWLYSSKKLNVYLLVKDLRMVTERKRPRHPFLPPFWRHFFKLHLQRHSFWQEELEKSGRKG